MSFFKKSNRSFSRHSNTVGGYQKSQTYSNGGNGDLNGVSTIHSYSEIYESATRESIDETTEELKSYIIYIANMRFICTYLFCFLFVLYEQIE